MTSNSNQPRKATTVTIVNANYVAMFTEAPEPGSTWDNALKLHPERGSSGSRDRMAHKKAAGAEVELRHWCGEDERAWEARQARIAELRQRRAS